MFISGIGWSTMYTLRAQQQSISFPLKGSIPNDSTTHSTTGWIQNFNIWSFIIQIITTAKFSTTSLVNIEANNTHNIKLLFLNVFPDINVFDFNFSATK
jgi:hypothetical protein